MQPGNPSIQSTPPENSGGEGDQSSGPQKSGRPNQRGSILPFSPVNKIPDSPWPVRLRTRSTRVKHGYSWRIIIRIGPLAMAEGLPMNHQNHVIYLIFQPEIEKEEKIEEKTIQKHEVIPCPTKWDKKDMFQMKTEAAEEILRRAGLPGTGRSQPV